VSDPGARKVPVVRRRRSRRHRRNRMIRRVVALAASVLFVTIASTVALQYLSPSLFRGQRPTPTSFQQAELRRQHVSTLNQILSTTKPAANRPVYPYSVVPGGVEDAKELRWVAEHDPIVAAHYAGFDYDHARVVRLTLARTAYVSYRIGNRVYWTHRRVTLHKGEKLITDGRMTARGRCANRVEEAPQQSASPVEPPVEKFDEPVRSGTGTAMQAPPGPFQSALLNRPGLSGLGASGPLSLYDPLVGTNWTPISPPPLPAGLCAPAKKNGTVVETGCCAGEEGVGKKKKGGGCGGSAVVPEPTTWLMLASGLVLIYWRTRRNLGRA
jgi:hypothetical protein